MEKKFDLYMQEFITLRHEVTQSIVKQHQITLGGYGFAGVVLGVAFETDASISILLGVPVVLLAMAALWMVECNRMVRASYYIGFHVWPELEKILDIDKEGGWEKWVRDKDDKNSTNFRKRQNRLQFFVIVIVPIFISIILLVFEILKLEQGTLGYLIPFSIVVSLIWIYLCLDMSKISNLAAIVAEKNIAVNNTSEQNLDQHDSLP